MYLFKYIQIFHWFSFSSVLPCFHLEMIFPGPKEPLLSISSSVGLLQIISGFVFLETSLFLPSLFKYIFLFYRKLWTVTFTPCLILVSMFSWESAAILVIIILKIMCLFSLFALMILSLVFKTFTKRSPSVGFFVWISLELVMFLESVAWCLSSVLKNYQFLFLHVLLLSPSVCHPILISQAHVC